MKNLKIAFFCFCFLNLLQFSSCAKIEKDQNADKIALDSVSFYFQKINDQTVNDTIRLIYCNKALSFANNLAADIAQANTTALNEYLKKGEISKVNIDTENKTI